MEALHRMGYKYVQQSKDPADMVLRQVKNPAKGFEWVNQEHYDKLGDEVIEFLYEQLTSTYGLECRTELHPDVKIFASPGMEDHTGTLLIILQGAGAVRPGMWARKLCINNSLRDGTIFPYIIEAKKRGWAVLVPNPNERPKVVGLRCAEEHLETVWKTYVAPCKAKQILMVAHSYGGKATLSLLKRMPEVMTRLERVAFTDSVHTLVNEKKAKSHRKSWHIDLLREAVPEVFEEPSEQVLAYLGSRTRNWAASDRPLDTKIGVIQGVPCVSAGHEVHEWTSATALSSVMRFLDGAHASAESSGPAESE
eukprot:Sspe_Gene.77431::Locus_48387_Transcript_2_2_Confidence_0.667_Length_1059::g.77431::m.77431